MKTILPLEGIRVLELAGAPGTWTTGLLADFGAEVIKVERFPPTNLDFTVMGVLPSQPPKEQRKRRAFDSLNRNKKSIALNLKVPEARDVFLQLVKISDVVLEGYRPGVAKRLGIDYETLTEINPRIIYCALTGYGQTGPYKYLVGHDINYIAVAGVLDLTGKPDEAPIIPGTQVGDWGGGASQAAIGILLSLLAREKTGKGQFIDISMTDGIISWLGDYARGFFAEGKIPRRGKTVPTGGFPYNAVYKTKDGRYISVGCWEPWFYENLCRALGREDLIPLQHAPEEKRKDIFLIFGEIFKERTAEEWFSFLRDKDVAVAPVHSFEEVFEDPQVKERGMVVEIPHPEFDTVKQIGIPIKVSETPGRIRSFAPQYGEHTEEILENLVSLSEEDIRRLKEKQAIGCFE